MKVLMFGWEYPPHISGGLGTACYGITKGLANNNVEIIFVVPKIFGDEERSHLHMRSASEVPISTVRLNTEKFMENMTFLEVNSYLVPYLSPDVYTGLASYPSMNEKTTHDSVFSPTFKFSGAYGKDLFAEVYRYSIVASQLALNDNFDVIHAHDWLTFLAGIAAKEVSGKPLVVHAHATEFDRSGENVNQQVYDIERKGFQAADKVITVSNLTRDILIERYGVDPDKIVTVHNAVDHPKQKYDDEFEKKYQDKKIVTFLGRITFQKGPDYFVEAAYKVIQRNKNVLFVMAGSGDLHIRMIKRVAELKIGQYFKFTGFLKGDDVERMFALSDVYVMPSVSEPFGISPLEAMRSNVPTIISKQSGVSEVLKNAIKVDFWDVDAIADAIYALVNYTGLSRRFKNTGRNEVQQLSWDKTGAEIKSVYESVL